MEARFFSARSSRHRCCLWAPAIAPRIPSSPPPRPKWHRPSGGRRNLSPRLVAGMAGARVAAVARPLSDHGPRRIAPGAGGATSFVFDQGQLFGWQMTIQGSDERLMDWVLPHEITHMVFASHFGHPLPRWADEGVPDRRAHHREGEAPANADQLLFAPAEASPSIKCSP